jgi:hypothetical protein
MIRNLELLKASVYLLTLVQTVPKYKRQNKGTKAKDSNEETVNNSEEIINNLIADKNELILSLKL